ncbi:hypothetical protein SELMODRAFT_413196 [Selaginella moellendorffii]|uniref:Uncharacterized protein n=2 Tax=Selaginella moellendorffii TaxID=88036 RepID=D8RNN3_SELML|nr:hypothetical protein SELMODRAFT_413196 [Selaginella moellendorffii]
MVDASGLIDHGEARDEDYAGEELRRYFVQEWSSLKELLDSIVAAQGSAELGMYKKAQSIIDKYQEQGHLLEPHLEVIVVPLMEVLRSNLAACEDIQDADLEIVKNVCCVIHKLITVCGYKTVVKFFPHQASDLEVTVALLERCDKEIKECGSLKEESVGEYETKCSLLLWLSILVLIPFDLASVDTALGYSTTSTASSSPLVERMLNLCKQFLSCSGPVREMAGVVLSRLLTRPDIHSHLLGFMAWSQDALKTSQDSSTGVFLIPGTVNALAGIFKVGDRSILLEIAPIAWKEASALSDSPLATRSPLLRKLLVKLIQRIGLTYLPPKLAAWRYMLGTKSLSQNLEKTSDVLPDDASAPTAEQDEDGCDVPEVIEEIMEKLLSGLKDKDTVVRWSAAKGLGRVTSRLSSENADDVVASVLELFSPTEGDGAWHGGCLALAELARRGLLLPRRLPEVVPLIIQALHYDVRRGPHSVGAHVRDAAAYVCWAFARAYMPALMSEHLKKLAPEMIAVACYDREVNCRRAASAAFQENVGRQGNFLHGIDIVNVSDYFSVGSRPHAYQHVAVFVGQYEEYRKILIDDLLLSKIRHWDRGLRELAVVALSLLVKYDPELFETKILGSLGSWSLSADLNLRHGATLAAAEVTRALHECGFKLSAEKEKLVAGMVPAIEKARLYRGKGGEIMRAAVSRLIECTASSGIPISSKTKKILQDTLDENLKHPNAQIQAVAAAGFKRFVTAYCFPVNSSAIASTTTKHLQGLKDVNPARRRGSALALGSLPQEFLFPLWKDVVDGLCSACLEENVEERDPEARVNAVRGLRDVCNVLANSQSQFPDDFSVAFVATLGGQVSDCLFKALDDYAIDNRGDVGSWIREAAMEALETCTVLLCKLSDTQSLVDERFAVRVFGGLIKQAAEKIDRIREAAGKTLQRMLHKQEFTIPCLPHRCELQQIFPSDESLLWADPMVAYPRLVRLILFPAYRSYFVAGLIVSVGGISQTLGKVSLQALLDFLNYRIENDNREISLDQDRTGVLARELSLVLKTSAGNDRLALPAIKTIDALFSKGAFNDLKSISNTFATEILDSLQAELKGSKDVSKILSCINVFMGIASLQVQASKQAQSQLLTLLGHRYPKVRKVAAEQLYLVLLQNGQFFGSSDAVDMALGLLLETCWDGPIEGLRDEKKKLLSLFGVLGPAPSLDNNAGSQHGLPPLKSSDENASYASLVDAAGY